MIKNQGHINILLIEDDEDDAFLIQKYLKGQCECTVVHAVSLENVMQEYSQILFNIILLDLNLPDSSGPATIIQTKALIPNTPIIVLTGSDDDETVVSALENGADDYLSKGEINKQNLKRIILFTLERNKLLLQIMEREEMMKELYLELEEKNKQLQHLAIRDPLTGLFNRRYIDESLERDIAITIRNKMHLFFLVFDIDNFKLINDTYGHSAGDSILVQITGILVRTCRDSDICGRFGGDEFIAYGTYANEKDYLLLSKRLISSIRDEKFIHDNTIIKVSVSIGVSTLNMENPDPQQLFVNADTALYKAKEKGRDRIVGFYKENYIEITKQVDEI
jgi:diguanylate cyclase (GGDEF)-like protein